ncbi:MAG TPA: TIGR03936 family radical SAM-associated protein, partial [Nitrospirota bacterium]|nr:TIGR03936 family radical SAM-associated protein [Nitrospirota bacterium]
DLSKVKTKICLFFPDTYEIGMSHLGLRILYFILNSRQDTACERVFSPWHDYEKKLRAANRPLTSLESNLPLAQFDIIGITLQYELSYSNILAGLDLARIPLRSAERTDAHPVIIAGGPCAVNPGPLSDFIDVFFIGEAEEAIHELIELKQAHADRRQFLEAISRRDGFFVPAFGKAVVRRRHLRSIESAPYPDRPILPLMKPVHDRVTVEVARGCIRGCRFCQAGIIYRPFRERSPERVKNILQESLACTGYEELSLASLSSGDYSAIQPLVVELMEKYRDGRISVSLPSLRVGTLTPEMIEAIAGTRKTGFTLAPEAGTERLRRVINKPVSDLDLLGAAETIFKNGWSVLKLYFMIGLPTETDEDLDGIIRLGLELLACGKRLSKRQVQINISVSTFVPKPHTPFQWLGQASLEEIRRKQAYLDKGLRRRGISLKPHNPETSLLEGAFARGDQALGRVLEEANALGCRFDGWSESFDFAKWTDAFRKCGLDPAAYACRSFGMDEGLAWDNVQSGVTKEFLKREYRRALEAELTENCRVKCEHCGIGCKDGGTTAFGKPAPPGAGLEKKLGVPLLPPIMHPGPQELTTLIRMKYSKTGRVRFLSHLDLMALFQRAAARAGIPVTFSRGFNPHPKISFGPALSVGMESEAEYLDMETDPFVDLPQITGDLNSTLPEGIRILESKMIPRKSPSLSG